MKKLLLILLLANNAAADINQDAMQHLKNNNFLCDEVSHIQELNYGNIKIYDITCLNTDSTIIYNFVPEQTVITHYLGDK